MPRQGNPLTYALYLLGRRNRTELELRTKLTEKGYVRDVIDQTMKKLESLDLINDQNFAELYVRDKVSIYRRGKYRIGLELLYKGVDKELIDQALGTIDEKDELRSALSLLEGRRRSWRELHERKRFERANQLLQRRGFTGKVIRQAMAMFEDKEKPLQ